MAKKGVTRKQLLKDPDEFITITGRMVSWCRQNPKKLFYGGCSLLGVIILLSVYSYVRQNRSREAFSLLSQGLAKYQAAEQDSAAKLTAAKSDFEQLVTRFGNRPAGRLGRIILAHLNLKAGSADEAIAFYKQAFEDFSGDPSLGNIILNGLASAYEQKGDNTAAIDSFEKIVQSKNIALKDKALFHLGRLYGQSGEAEKSSKAYGQLTSDFPNSIYTPMAREIVDL